MSEAPNESATKDSIKSHQEFIEKDNLRFDLLSDEKQQFLKNTKLGG